MSKKQIRYKDVAIAYLTGGVDKVQTLDISRRVLKRALKWLKEEGEPHADLESWCLEVHGLCLDRVKDGARTHPQEGDLRSFTAQKGKTGAWFVKLPLSTFEGISDNKKRVFGRFHKNRIEVVSSLI